MKINNLSYTLIIPTRNRQATALAAIASGLACRYPYLQIVVSDNSDDDRLRAELARRGWLDKVTYHKTERVLSMRDNWERGLDLAQGEYVSVIGDDDAILPDAPLLANVIFSRDPDLEVVQNGQAIYKWPDYPFPGRQNFLRVDFDTRFILFSNPREVLKAAIDHRMNLGTGPGLYYGFVRRDFLERLKRQRGRWLVDPVPDFDSGYATLMYAKRYARNQRVMFIAGHCGKSNSGAMRYAVKHDEHTRTFAQEAGWQAEEAYLSELPWLRNNNTVIVACQFRMLDEIRAALGDPNADINRVGAWNYIAKSVTDGYENISFMQARESLEKLADLWGIRDQVKLPEARPISGGLFYEQGPKDSEKKRDGADEADDAAETAGGIPPKEKFDRLIVDGNKLGFRTILDAARFIQATQPSSAATKSQAVRAYFEGWRNKHLEPLLVAARQHLAAGRLSEAESNLLAFLREDSTNADAARLLGEVYQKQGRISEAATQLASAMTWDPRVSTLRLYVQACLALGVPEQALDLVERSLAQNPNHPEIMRLAQKLRQAGKDADEPGPSADVAAV